MSQYDVQMLSADCAEGVTEPCTVYTGRSPQCVVAGLSPGQKYTFEVRASNSAGVYMRVCVCGCMRVCVQM